ncbi:hypothetical protein [Kitasatospora cheerisanensis]|uniref:hypothetical protein n=1 Tax=Kitasatospora cheerisanensis TaxID=81942 RepID=UPI000564E9B3|nr:hypothetical protein [Kitasatospora cheerisanensis]
MRRTRHFVASAALVLTAVVFGAAPAHAVDIIWTGSKPDPVSAEAASAPLPLPKVQSLTSDIIWT